MIFQEECKTFVEEQSIKKAKGRERLKASVVAYINYFVEYPGIFDLFYMTKPSGIGINSSALNVIATSLDNVCQDDWNYCMKEELILEQDIEKLKAQLRFIVVGMLLFYLNRRIPVSYTEFINQINIQINSLLT